MAQNQGDGLPISQEEQDEIILFALQHIRDGAGNSDEHTSREEVLEELRHWTNNTQREFHRRISRIMGLAQTIRDDEQSAMRHLQVSLNPAVSNDDRFVVLDACDRDMSNAWDEIGNVIDRLIKLEDWYGARPGSVLMDEIQWSKEQYERRRSSLGKIIARLHLEKLHPIKRITPGRKVPYTPPEDFMQPLEQESAELSKIIPVMPRIIPLPGRQGPATWHIAHTVNEGAMNNGVNIMTSVDRNQRIVQRMARKDVQLPPKDNHYYWRGDLSGGNGRMLPQEYVVLRLMSREDAQYVIKNVATYRYENETRIAKIYMEYAPHGHLRNVISLHRQANEPIPEHFLWLLLRGLVETAFIMKYGSLNKDEQPDNSFEIVHRDLKPENILLGANDPVYFKNYPTPKVSDFGLAILTRVGDKCNPWIYDGAGTNGYKAPEQLLFYDPVSDRPVDDVPIESPCNVWAIGASMYALMTLVSPNQLPYHVAANPPTGREFDFDVRAAVAAKWPAETYSPDLIDVVQKCMHFEARTRPTVDELREYLEALFRQEAHLSSMASGQDHADGPPPRLRHRPETEGYRMGMVYQL